jgi:hypothetical protein
MNVTLILYATKTSLFVILEVKFEVLMEVKISMLVFRVVIPYGIVVDTKVLVEYTVPSPKDVGSMFLRNVNIYVQVHTALQRRRPTSTLFFVISNSILSLY